MYDGIYRMWHGRRFPEVRVLRCDYAEEILKSSKHTEKSNTYTLLEPWLGRGTTGCDVFITRLQTILSFVSGLISSSGIKIHFAARLRIHRTQSRL